jgi:RNA polymerase sigma-70 factor (ECF subfamily)
VTEPETSLDPEAELRALCVAERWGDAATWIIERYGRELMTYLVAIARSETDAGEAFSQLTEDLWRGLPRFRWQSAARTWCYTLARHSLFRVRRSVRRRGGPAIALSDAPELARATEQLRTATITYLRTQVKDEVAALRERLSPDDQAILILRIDRKLPWLDVARALAEEDDEELPDAELTRRSATLRKRFGRIKSDLKKLLESRLAERDR